MTSATAVTVRDHAHQATAQFASKPHQGEDMRTTVKTFAVQRQCPPSVAPVSVEVDVRAGLPAYTIVGLLDRAVHESHQRVRCALLNSGFEFPARRITINIALGQAQRVGAEVDLAIACGLLAATGQLPGEWLASHALFGELSVSGEVVSSSGALLVAEAALASGAKTLVLASGRAREAALVDSLEVLVADHLGSVVRVLGGGAGDPLPAPREDRAGADFAPDLSDIRGPREGIEALTLAAAGGHSLLLVGSPGCGKSMLATRLPGILPPLNDSEALEVTRLASILGRSSGEGMVCEHPFRAPHHTVSAEGLVGGIRRRWVGEAQLANRGVLFLDELHEFSRVTLEALGRLLDWQPGAVGWGGADYPVHFNLVAATNPCACGYRPRLERCRCSEADLARHRRRLDSTLGGRFDIVAQLERPNQAHDHALDTTSEEVRKRVLQARDRQYARQPEGGAPLNAEIDRDALQHDLALTATVEQFVRRVCVEQRLTDSDLDRLLRVARTAADLDGSPAVGEQHISLALSLRGSPVTAE
jgi:magnesium chelatase family protein